MNEIEERLVAVDPPYRVLLLAQCLRPSQTCPGKFDKKGLACPEDCSENCVIGRLREFALGLGYSGVCIAAGGAMALRFVKEHNPRGIVAVACGRELGEGVDGVKELFEDNEEIPAIVVLPLLRDGCVDTEVDEEQVLKALALGSATEWGEMDMQGANRASL
jgi:hypothetical protein